MNFKKLICSVFMLAALCAAPLTASAAPVTAVRSSVSPARVRLVFDSTEPIKYTDEKNGLQIVVNLPEGTALAQSPVIKKDVVIKSITVPAKKKKKAQVVIDLTKDCQYKLYNLKNPDRLVLDIYRIPISKTTTQLAGGVTYTYAQEELNGRPIVSYLVSVAPAARLELRPFSAAGMYNGRGSLAKQAAERGLVAAINASYFDTDGWVIGNVKDKGNFVAMDATPRSGYVVQGNEQKIVRDIAYTGSVTLPDGRALQLKGMNRARIANDLVLFNSHYATSTKTNQYGREVKIKNGRVVAVSTAGNMSLEPGCVVLSGHGTNAAALAGLRLGDHIILTQSLGSSIADAATTVVSGGPLLVENGRVNVRTAEEQMAPDIARGRAPRTAIGLKQDGTLLMLVIDGRSSASAGMTLAELAQYFLKLGAVSAVNYDGGGSSEMVINGKIVNKPSDGRERLVSIGLGLFIK